MLTRVSTLCLRGGTLSLLVCALGCETMPGPAYPDAEKPGRYSWDGDPAGTQKTGHEYCASVEKSGRDHAKQYAKAGWILSILATASATIPAVISATSGDQLSSSEKAWNIVLPISSALFTAGALAAFMRESHVNRLAKEATLAVLEPDASAVNVCVSAVADWQGERGDASEAVRARMGTAYAQAPRTGNAASSELVSISASRQDEVAARLTVLRQTASLEQRPAALETVEKIASLLRVPRPSLPDLAQSLRVLQDTDPRLAADAKALEDLLSDALGMTPVPAKVVEK